MKYKNETTVSMSYETFEKHMKDAYDRGVRESTKANLDFDPSSYLEPFFISDDFLKEKYPEIFEYFDKRNK